MLSYTWQGNVRELENKIRKALILSKSSTIQPEDLDIISIDINDSIEPMDSVRAKAEREAVHKALLKSKGNLTLSARLLSMDRKVFTRLIEKLGFDAKSFKIIDSYALSFDYTNQQMPFYTRIYSIDTYVWDIDFNVELIKEIYTKVKNHLYDEEELFEIEKDKLKEELDMTLYSNYNKQFLGL